MEYGADSAKNAGVVVYADNDGDKPAFTFSLDNWDGADSGKVSLQALRYAIPGGNASTNTTVQKVILRMEVEEDGGGVGTDSYTFKYDLLGGAEMQTLTTYDSSFDNSRVGVFLKDNTSSDVYFNTLEVAPEPATMSLLALGGIAMLKRRKK